MLEREVQSSLGFGKLDSAEREQLTVFLGTLIYNQRDRQAEEAASAIGWENAEEYLEEQGYEKLPVVLVDKSGTTFLLVEVRASTYVTDDLPIGFPTLSFESGDYWCDPSFEGVRSVLVGSDEHSFSLADWREL